MQLLSEPLSVEYLNIEISGLSQSLRNTKIVQMSDFHFDGLLLSEELLAQAINTSNQIQPDLVLLTGDFVTHSPKPIHQLAKRLKSLKSRAGIYAVLGNHDLYFPNSKAEITSALTSVGIQVLWNQIAYPLGSELALVGLPDYWSPEFNPALVMRQLDVNTPRIVLSHNPDSAEALQKWRVDLQLSGHTHGGQIVIPGIGAVPSWIHASRHEIPEFLWNWIPFFKGEMAKSGEKLAMESRFTLGRYKQALCKSRFGNISPRTLALSSRSDSDRVNLKTIKLGIGQNSSEFRVLSSESRSKLLSTHRWVLSTHRGIGHW